MSDPVHASEYLSRLKDLGNLALPREEYVPVVPVAHFLDCTVPHCTEEHARGLKERLVQARAVTKKDFWSGFFVEPKDSSSDEASILQRMKKIFNSIIRDDRPNATVIAACSHTPWDESDRDSVWRPGGFLKLRQPSLKHGSTVHPWEDIVQAWEAKKEDTIYGRRHLFERIIWSAYYILAVDPRREWTTGLTIENVNARLWYFDRSRVVVSQTFDFRKGSCLDHLTLIRFWHGTAFASLEKFGYDTTINLVQGEDGPPHYDICVKGKPFRTTKILSSVRSGVIVGRGTRVRLACDASNPSKTYVIRDTWISKDSLSETEIRECLRDAIKKNPDDNERKEDMEKYERHFLTHQADLSGPVISSCIDLVLDDHVKENLHILPLPPPQNDISLGWRPSFGPWTPSEPTPASLYRPRTHVRDVYLEECIPYHALTSMQDMIQTLNDCTEALRLLWKYGFVHRNISIENIVWDPTVKAGRLIDLELVKNINDEGCLGVETDAPRFMAGEICCALSLFNEDGAATSWMAFNPDCPTPSPRFHVLHDLESIWWIAVWTCAMRVPKLDADRWTDEELIRHHRIANIMFPYTRASGERRYAFAKGRFISMFAHQNDRTQALRSFIIGLGKYLLAQYSRKPCNDIDDNQFRDVYTEVLKLFDCLRAEVKEQIPVWTLEDVVRRRQEMRTTQRVGEK